MWLCAYFYKHGTKNHWNKNTHDHCFGVTVKSISIRICIRTVIIAGASEAVAIIIAVQCSRMEEKKMKNHIHIDCTRENWYFFSIAISNAILIWF